MLLGDRLDGAYTDWRVVEDDLYHVAGRVREYDSEARLLRQEGTGLLGLGRYVENYYLTGTRGLAFVRPVVDMNTDVPLRGVPDARVIKWMWWNDGHRIDIKRAQRRSDEAYFAREARNDARTVETFMEPAERYVHAMRDDLSAKPFAAIPRGV